MAFVRVPGNPEPEGAEELWFEGRGGVKLRAMLAPALGGRARGSVILFAGRTEFIEKYFEVVSELQSRGFACFIMDWRGQGLSDREVDNRLKGHFHSFDDPVADLALALRRYAARLPRPHIVLAHSMGGAIALRALQTNRMTAEAAIYCAPMWSVASLKGLGEDLVRFLSAIGFGHAFVPGVDRTWARINFQKNALTNDKERYARAQGLVTEEPRLAIAGPTIGWAAAAVEAMNAFRQPNALKHLRMPTVVLTAEDEALLDNRGIIEVTHAFSNVEHHMFEGARHEMLMETDDIRSRFWAIFDDVAARVAPPGGAIAEPSEVQVAARRNATSA